MAGGSQDATPVSNTPTGAGSGSNSELAWAWDTHSAWSQAADKLKQSLMHARYASLGLTSARVVSEALKGETFKFLAGVAPYRGPDRQHQFAVSVQTILDNAAGSGDPTVGLKPARRAVPSVADVGSYITERVRKQIDDYKPQSAPMAQRGRRFRTAAIVLAVVALLLSAATTMSGRPEAAAWSAVIATVIPAAQRYDALALEYSRTYQQLDRLQHNRIYSSEQPSEKDDDDLVTAAEAVISAQNQASMVGTVAAAAAPTGPRSSGHEMNARLRRDPRVRAG